MVHVKAVNVISGLRGGCYVAGVGSTSMITIK